MGFLPALAPAVAGAAGAAGAAAPALAAGAAGAAAPALAAGGLPAALAAKAAPALAAGVAAPSAVPLSAALKAGAPLVGAPSAAAAPMTQGLGSLVNAPAGTNLASTFGAADKMVSAGAQNAVQAGASPFQAGQMGQRLQRLGRALAGSGQGGGGAAPSQSASPQVSRGDRQPQAGGPMSTLPQQGVEESPGMQLFTGAPMMPMGGGEGLMSMNPMPMNPTPMNPMSETLSGNMYASPMPMMRDGGYIEGPGTGRSDSIPTRIYQDGRPVQEARLSDGEFVMTERAVRGAGNGDRAKGAARMYRMMRDFEKGGRVHGRA